MHNNHDVSPIDLAKSLTPWWMQRMRDFDGLQIWPCRNIRISGKPKTVMCRTEQATFWTVYGHYRVDGASINGGIEPFEDFPNPVAAEQFCKRLKDTYKHLNRDRIMPAPEIAPKSFTL